MRSGTTTMKMISSTSTTSTSGVMLISDCRLDPESPLSNCMSFSPRAGAFRDQPHTAKSGFFDCDHGLTDLLEVEPCIGPDHDLGFLLGAHCRVQGVAELLGCDLMIVDPELAGIVDRDQHTPSLVALISRLRGVRQVHVWPLPHLRRHHHKNDQEHKHHVYERRDV